MNELVAPAPLVPIEVSSGPPPKPAPAPKVLKVSCDLCGHVDHGRGSLTLTLPVPLCKQCRIKNKIVIPSRKRAA